MESTVVCVDNSECTRNGDFEPSRFEAQSDAINLLAGAKTGANPENTVGILTIATTSAKAPKVMVTPTADLGKVLTAMSEVTIEGSVDICKATQIAQLALKHRQNKNQRQRIVLFVGSPILEDVVRSLCCVANALARQQCKSPVVRTVARPGRCSKCPSPSYSSSCSERVCMAT